MAAVEADVRAALSRVEEPELRRSIADLGMVREVARKGKRVTVTLALPLPGDDTRAELQPPGRRGGGSGAGRRPGRRRSPRHGRRRAARGRRHPEGRHAEPAPGARCRRRAACARAAREPVHRHPHPRARDRVGQGRSRQVVGHHEPLHRARAARPASRRSRRRRLGFLDAAHARHLESARTDRRRDRAARALRRAAHLDGLLRA